MGWVIGLAAVIVANSVILRYRLEEVLPVFSLQPSSWGSASAQSPSALSSVSTRKNSKKGHSLNKEAVSSPKNETPEISHHNHLMIAECRKKRYLEKLSLISCCTWSLGWVFGDLTPKSGTECSIETWSDKKHHIEYCFQQAAKSRGQ